ncbi:MAG: hypothetical protein AAFP98_13030, partial [Pseudomonadota bacterium]
IRRASASCAVRASSACTAQEAEARRIAEAEAAAAEAAAAEAAEIAAAKAAEAQARAEAAALAAATLDTPTPPVDADFMTILATMSGAPQLPLAAFNAKLPTDPSLNDLLADLQIAGLVTGATVPEGQTTPNAPSNELAAGDLPSVSGNAPVGDQGVAPVDVTDGEGFLVATLPLTEAIPAFTPGNEVAPEIPEASFVLSAWTVELPFEASSSSSRTIGSVGPIAPVWVNEGVEIETVNGSPIQSIAGINEVLRSSVELADENVIALDFGITDTSGQSVEATWTVPIVQRTALLNGVGFETRQIDDVWVTRVTTAPEQVAGDLKVGDELVAYMRTSEQVDQRTSLKEILEREIADGQSQFSFAVRRDGTMWIASLEYGESDEE